MSVRFVIRTFSALAAGAMLFVPVSAFAQDDKTEVDIAPLYLWAARNAGHVAIDNKTVPFFMDFRDATKHLAGAFALHGEVRHGRWGVIGDVNFIRLSTDANFTTPIVGVPVTGTGKVDTVIFEGGASYLVNRAAGLALIGGVRTYTLSPRFEFADSRVTAIDVSKTSVSGFGGFIYRPQLLGNTRFLSRADIGGGTAFTWSATLGLEYQPKTWIGLMAGYRALGLDTGSVARSGPVVKTLASTITQYGPIFSANFHWKQK